MRTDGVMLKYLKAVKVAWTGSWWLRPLLQSLTRFFLKNWSWRAVREFWNWPEYEMRIF